MFDSFDSNQHLRHSRFAINFKLVACILGILLYMEAFLFLVCTGVSYFYHDPDYMYFIYCILINTGIGSLLMAYGKGCDRRITQREGYIVVALSWLLFSFLGMLPYIFSGDIPNVADAFFETMSGFTTTGASIIDNLDQMTHGMLFWRALTNWMGGLGIVLFTIAFFPMFTGCSQQLFLSESTGVTHDKIQPRASTVARYIWFIYIILTSILTGLLVLGGMDVFDAVCHAFATTATGGFSTKGASIAYWDSAYIEYIISLFMLLSGINFTLYYFITKGKIKDFFKDAELRWFLKSVGVLTLIITIALVMYNDYGIEKAFRKALFQVATCHTSCGFATDDYNLWPQFTWLLLIFAMISGGCTGSTSGGLKNLRLLIIMKNIVNHFKQMLHPNAVLPLRVNGTNISYKISSNVYTFVFAYLFCIFVGWVLLMSFGVGLTEAFGCCVSAIGNVGPGLGAFGPAYTWSALPDSAKWVLSALMLIGRLEVFSVLCLFYKGLWKD